MIRTCKGIQRNVLKSIRIFLTVQKKYFHFNTHPEFDFFNHQYFENANAASENSC